MQLKDEKKPKHFITNNCINTCAKFTLNASMTINKNSFGMV